MADLRLRVRDFDLDGDEFDPDSGELDDDQPDAENGHSTATPEQLTVLEKRRAQNLKFQNYVTQQARKRILSPEKAKKMLQEKDDDDLDIKSLLAKQDTMHLTDPREYQRELFERAKRENVIAVLDTGSGKTLIAVLLLRHIIDEELEARANGNSARISFFLVDSVTLVFQQATVLETNLDSNVLRLYGAMGSSLTSQKFWSSAIKDHMVIVCTAEILHKALVHTCIRMDQINLLIFDEAHHAKKNHPFATIIHDFYMQQDSDKRPKVFGMTASPVDAKVQVAEAARDLEKLLHSRIVTTSNLAELALVNFKPEELVIKYDPLHESIVTEHPAKIFDICGELPELKRVFQRSLDAGTELGVWPAELYWPIAFTEDEVQRKTQKIQNNCDKQCRPVSELDEAVAMLEKGHSYVESYTQSILAREIEPTSEFFSSKVLKLRELLVQIFERPTDSRCIVFVERRHTASMLHSIFDRIGTPHLKPGSLVGQADWGNFSDSSVRGQVVTITKFRRGAINCLFATTIAEEGLDIPDCNVVIRFDLYRTMIQYIQSRGRARHKNSTYYHMMEAGNSNHIARIVEARQAEKKMREFCNILPEDRKLKDLDADATAAVVEGRGFRVYQVPTTGAKLTYGDSLAILMRYVDSWCLNFLGEDMTTPPQYNITTLDDGFVCEVILPPACPISNTKGRPYSRKSYAKRSAAFEACLQLRKIDELDDRLLPVHVRQTHAMANAMLALNLKTSNNYTRMIKPDRWEKTRGTCPTELFLTVLDIDGQMDRPHQPLGLLTRTPLPQLPRFPLWLNTGRMVSAKVESSSIALPIGELFLGQLTEFTFRMYLDVFNKVYERDVTKMDYWMVPLLPDVGKPGSSPLESIDWETLMLVLSCTGYKWTKDTTPGFLLDKFYVDPFDGGRRNFSTQIHPTLTPQDSVPSDAHKFKPSKPRTILEYSCSLYKNSAGRRVAIAQMNPDQPVIVAEAVQLRRNYLAEPQAGDKSLSDKLTDYMCPESFRISTLPTKVVVMMLLLPAILHRIEEYLIALEACELVNIQVNPAVALEAMTKDSDNSEEHSETQINFKKGMGNNYERLEFLGDCFLKMATSISLFVLQAKSDEFEYHVDRMVLVCNKNLYNTAVKLKLYEYIRSQSFNRAEWYPHGLKLLKGKGKDKIHYQGDHTLGDKTIADVCEALIGGAFLEHNQPNMPWRSEHWDNAIRAVTALTNHRKHTAQCWEDYRAGYSKPEYQTATSTASQLDMAAKVATEHDYHFNYPRLLRSAFIHPSQPFSAEKVPNYQRLEFLGDALLDLASVAYLFYRYPDRDPQWLTEHKMAMVSNKFLGAVSVRLGFHRHLRHSHSQLEKQIREYVADIQDAERDGNGAMDYWTSVRSPPKCLPDVVESYVGALFIDSDFNYGEVQRFFDQHIAPFFVDMTLYDTFAGNHPTTRLYQLLSINLGCQDYRLLAREMLTLDAAIGAASTRCMAGVMIHDRIIADGESSSIRYAKLRACGAALDRLEGLAPFEYRVRFGCDCKWKGEEVPVNPSPEDEAIRVAEAAQEQMTAMESDTAA